jgi:hypothetical protein
MISGRRMQLLSLTQAGELGYSPVIFSDKWRGEFISGETGLLQILHFKFQMLNLQFEI